MSPFLDVHALTAAVRAAPPTERLVTLLRLAGCGFSHEDPRLVTRPAAALVLVGGMPLSGMSQDDVVRATTEGMGLSAFMSYLSLPGGSLEAAGRTVTEEHGHLSVAHAAQVGVLLAGISLACEAEFDAQRDVLHLSRVTVARTGVQSDPPVVLPNRRMAAAFGAVLDAARAARATVEADDADAREAANLMFPAAKATAVLLSGSLRDFCKVLAAVDDEGKEREYRIALKHVGECLHRLWPGLFERFGPMFTIEGADGPPQPGA